VQLRALSGRLPLLAVVLLAVGCAPARNAIPGDYNAYTISEAELRNSSTQTAYEAVVKLRPNFLNYQAPTSVSNPTPGQPVVYVNEQFAGDVTLLSQLRVSQIESIKFFKPTDAMIRYGTDRTGGVIAVTLRE
jgi:hypothetical protein